MSNGEPLSSFYVEVLAKTDKAIAQMTSDFAKVTKTIQSEFDKFKLDVDTKVAKMKLDEVKTYQKQLKAQLAEQMKLNDDFSSIERTKTELNHVNEKLHGLGATSEEATGKMNSSFLSLGKTIVGTFAAKVVATFFATAIKGAAELAEMEGYFKGSTEDIRLFTKATDETVKKGDLIRLSNQASDLGIELTKQPILFLMANKAAEAYGGTAVEGFDKVIAASEGSAKAMKALGVEKAKYNELVKQGAAQHGTTIDKLDAETQKQIRLDAIIKASGLTMDDVNNASKSLADQIGSLSVKWDNLKMAIGRAAGEALVPVANKLDEVSQKLSDLDSNSKSLMSFADVLRGIGIVCVAAVESLMLLGITVGSVAAIIVRFNPIALMADWYKKKFSITAMISDTIKEIKNMGEQIQGAYKSALTPGADIAKALYHGIAKDNRDSVTFTDAAAGDGSGTGGGNGGGGKDLDAIKKANDDRIKQLQAEIEQEQLLGKTTTMSLDIFLSKIEMMKKENLTTEQKNELLKEQAKLEKQIYDMRNPDALNNINNLSMMPGTTNKGNNWNSPVGYENLSEKDKPLYNAQSPLDNVQQQAAKSLANDSNLHAIKLIESMQSELANSWQNTLSVMSLKTHTFSETVMSLWTNVLDSMMQSLTGYLTKSAAGAIGDGITSLIPGGNIIKSILFGGSDKSASAPSGNSDVVNAIRALNLNTVEANRDKNSKISHIEVEGQIGNNAIYIANKNATKVTKRYE